ncbi:response regulator [uncultured Thiodictyon sp.]|uniref:response regulator n=1 Tax=uncultured Thiodictyon sp. TaxID=1846217 RepID=UPI0025CFAB0E|nr:response regulator [uncultured Thiodictyon sp.]
MNEELAHRKILVIDDDLSLLQLTRRILERAGYQVFCAVNGADGMLLHEQQNPDLILLDLEMPVMDGITTLRNLRAQDNHTLVIILTGHGTLDSIRDAADLNVSEYLIKPFQSTDLVSIIDKALGS